MSGLAEFGTIEELYLMGASKKTICKMTKLPADNVDRIIHQIKKNKKIHYNNSKEDKDEII